MERGTPMLCAHIFHRETEVDQALLPEPLHPFSNSIFDRVPGRGSNQGVFGRNEMRDANSGGGYAPVSVGS